MSTPFWGNIDSRRLARAYVALAFAQDVAKGYVKENASILPLLSALDMSAKLIEEILEDVLPEDQEAPETDDLLNNARKKLDRKGADLILANDVSPETGIMGGEENAIRVVSRAGVEDWPRLAKAEVARKIVERVAAALGKNREAAE